jgi:diadenosine tetraphosphate (Ap4A) HIT family hydrolase
MPDEYARLTIREYEYWVVHINENQNYLGRSVIWCKRESARDLADAIPEEQKELFIVLADLKRTLAAAFAPDWFNYAFLGNAVHHLHCHFIPRYAKPRTFEGLLFEDKHWGDYFESASDKPFTVAPEVLLAIQSEIRRAL